MRDKLPNLSVELKTKVAQLLLENSRDDQLTKGKIKEVALLLHISRRHVTSIWTATRVKIREGEFVIFNTIKWSKHDAVKVDWEKLMSLPYVKRSSYKRIIVEMGVSKSVMGVGFKERLIRAHFNAIKPNLTAHNKLIRMHFCLNSLQYDRA
ncbi:hypothetical protein ACS0TY_019747 [Phlomoides rotata]